MRHRRKQTLLPSLCAVSGENCIELVFLHTVCRVNSSAVCHAAHGGSVQTDKSRLPWTCHSPSSPLRRNCHRRSVPVPDRLLLHNFQDRSIHGLNRRCTRCRTIIPRCWPEGWLPGERIWDKISSSLPVKSTSPGFLALECSAGSIALATRFPSIAFR